MGQSVSYEEEDEYCGYRVLGVQPNSPADTVGFVPFFDFIVAANGVALNKMDGTFTKLIQAHEDHNLPLTVYNWKNDSIREVNIVPTKNHGGEGMLGMVIGFDTYFQAERKLVRVLNVQLQSPAHIAGLQPMKDYLLGTAEKAFVDTEVLYETLNSSLDQPIELYVYNSDTDIVRIVVVLPTLSWGEEGIFGANVAHGYLHQLPEHCRKTIGKTLEPNQASNNYLDDTDAKFFQMEEVNINQIHAHETTFNVSQFNFSSQVEETSNDLVEVSHVNLDQNVPNVKLLETSASKHMQVDEINDLNELEVEVIQEINEKIIDETNTTDNDTISI